jgi:pimeloyl-ACP methyl ester carboxylesterase
MRGWRSTGIALAVCVIASLTGLHARAEPVSLVMPNGLNALAEYRIGKTDKPAVLLLHGFLQTHQFPTIFRLTEALHAEGYTVLAPTLTLGVPHRKQSLACEAIHTHTLDADADEIKTWLDWLSRQGHTSVHLIGHSMGSTNLLNFVTRHRHPAVQKLIGVSLSEARLLLSAKARKTLEQNLRQRLARADRDLIEHPLGFCKQYRGTPASLLSYVEWSPERILKSLTRKSIPQAYIMGGHDDRLEPGWIPRLKETGRPVAIIAGANHFMDGAHEFDLLDEVLKELRTPPPRHR